MYIEREALLAKAKTLPLGRGELWTGGERPKFVSFADVVKAPAADVVPVVPSWWECYETSAFGGYKDGEAVWWPRKFYRCERCRRGSAIRSNYCPNCGARMNGGSDG